MSDIKKDLLEFQIHCLNTDQLQVAELIQNAIKRIAELEQENNMLKRVEKIFNDSPNLTFNVVKKLFKDELSIFKLEQQAKGVEDFEKLFSFYDSEKDCELVYSEDAISYCAKLRKQAAKLKEQRNDN